MSSRTFWRIEGGANQGSGISSGRRGIASSYPGIIHSPSDKDSSNCHLVLRRVIDLERNFKGVGVGCYLRDQKYKEGWGRGMDLPKNTPKKEQLFSGSQQIGAHGLPLHQVSKRQSSNERIQSMSTGYHCFVDVDVRSCPEVKKQREVCNLHEMAQPPAQNLSFSLVCTCLTSLIDATTSHQPPWQGRSSLASQRPSSLSQE